MAAHTMAAPPTWVDLVKTHQDAIDALYTAVRQHLWENKSCVPVSTHQMSVLYPQMCKRIDALSQTTTVFSDIYHVCNTTMDEPPSEIKMFVLMFGVGQRFVSVDFDLDADATTILGWKRGVVWTKK